MSMEEVKNANLHIYGYCIYEKFIFHLKSSVLMSIDKKPGRVANLPCLKLRCTMSALLSYLLVNASKGVITDDELICMVWDNNGLKGSYGSLWLTMTGLKQRIRDIGLEKEFIYRVNGDGYMVDDSVIFPLFQLT